MKFRVLVTTALVTWLSAAVRGSSVERRPEA
jgi:hypothetical protein